LERKPVSAYHFQYNTYLHLQSQPFPAHVAKFSGSSERVVLLPGGEYVIQPSCRYRTVATAFEWCVIMVADLSDMTPLSLLKNSAEHLICKLSVIALTYSDCIMWSWQVKHLYLKWRLGALFFI
jgi:hypothetical protein